MASLPPDPSITSNETRAVVASASEKLTRADEKPTCAGKIKKLRRLKKKKRAAFARRAASLHHQAVVPSNGYQPIPAARKYNAWTAAELALLRSAATPDAKSGRYAWKSVAAELRAAGYVRTPTQCRNKFRTSCFEQSSSPSSSVLCSWPSLPFVPGDDGVEAAAHSTWNGAQQAVHAKYLELKQDVGRLSAVWKEQEVVMKATRKEYLEVLANLAKHAAFLSAG